MSQTCDALTDEQIVLECQRRHPKWRAELLEELHGRHEKRVFSICYRMTRNWHDARDACQETFANVFRSIQTFRRDARFSTWIHRIAVNTSIDTMRRSRGRPSWAHGDDTDPGVLADPDAATAPEIEAEQDLAREIQRTTDQLSTRLRDVVRLRYYEQLSYEEIATRLGISLGTVKSRLFRAHDALRERLDPVMYRHSG